MPIEVNYGVDPMLLAEAAAQGSGAAVAADQDRRNRQFAEAQYQSDRDYDWRVQSAMLQDRLARYQGGRQSAQFFAGLQSQNNNNQLDYMLGQQQLAQRDEQLGVQAAVDLNSQQQQTDRTRLAQLGQMARQQQDQKFQTFMAERKNFEDNVHRYTPLQQQQFRERLSQKYGIEYDAPEQVMASQAEEQQNAERQRMLGMLQAPDGSGEMMAPESVVDMLMQLPPEKQVDAWNKIHDTWTRRQKDLASSKQYEVKQQEAVANMQRDDERAAQQLQHTQEAHKQKLVMDAIKAVQQSKIARAKAIEGAMTTDGKGAIPKELTLSDLLPPELIPSSGPPSWYLELPVGAEYTAPDGTKRIKGK